MDPNHRLKNLRQLHGMTQKAFAAELGIGQSQLSQIERGDRKLTAQHMVTARQRFNIPLDFFSADPITYGPTELNYRTRKLTQTQQERAATLFGLTEQAVRNSVSTTNSTESLGVGDNSGQARPLREIESIAAAARQLIGIRHAKVINNVTRCIERIGVLVTGINLGDLSSRIDGISSPYRTDEPFVASIDLNKPGDRIRFSGAHELGHILLHTENNRPFDKDVRENEADMFASAFLLPRESIIEELSPGLTLAGYSRIKARWGVSIQAIIRRAFDLGVIDKDRYRSLHIQVSSRGWRTAEPVEVPVEVPAIPTPDIGGLRPFQEDSHLPVLDNVVSMFDRDAQP
jgi:Zn-dependent peptidase ImmA (M78 family)/DNA-binding XRE family transcriptional regulator